MLRRFQVRINAHDQTLLQVLHEACLKDFCYRLLELNLKNVCSDVSTITVSGALLLYSLDRIAALVHIGVIQFLRVEC